MQGELIMHRVLRCLANANLTSGVPPKYREVADEYLRDRCTAWTQKYIEESLGRGRSKEETILSIVTSKRNQEVLIGTMDKFLGMWLARHSEAMNKGLPALFLRDIR
jgi:Cft2 family RNA processing exonuclease